MKRIEDLFDDLRPRVRRGPLAAIEPLFDAINNFFLWPKTPTRLAPHVRDPLDVKRYMTMAILALAPPLAAGLYFFGLRVLAVVLVSYVVGGTVEVAIACLRKEEVNEGFFVTGLIFPLILPPGIPLWMVAVGIALGVIIGKEIFGGTGRNPFNAALVGRCILTLGYPKAMNVWAPPGSGWLGRLGEYVVPGGVDAVTTPTPLALAKQGTYEPIARMFWGNIQGSIGETSAFCILLGAAMLLVVGVVNWRTIGGAIGSFALLGGVLHAAAPDRFGPVGWHLLAGGFLFGTVYMATDPVTSPMTNPAKAVYGALIGVLVLLIRNLTGYTEGVTFAILLGNVAAPALDEAVIRWRMRRLAP
jgi:Na(+)-translocating NADH:ubiquinone oxidoreductase B subunit